jgi:hypothetical protein
MAWQGVQILFLVALLLASCSAPGGNSTAEGCGGFEATVSCLDITTIAPTYMGSATSAVDAFRDTCRNAAGMVTGVEPFTDHQADITFRNTRFPTASGGFDIRILGFMVSYTLSQYPAAVRGCPPLTGFSGESSIVVPAGGTVTARFPFVPLRVKADYVASGGDISTSGPSFSFPSYSAIYVFTAQTTRFNDMITVQGSAEFSIGDFNNCP